MKYERIYKAVCQAVASLLPDNNYKITLQVLSNDSVRLILGKKNEEGKYELFSKRSVTFDDKLHPNNKSGAVIHEGGFCANFCHNDAELSLEEASHELVMCTVFHGNSDNWLETVNQTFAFLMYGTEPFSKLSKVN